MVAQKGRPSLCWPRIPRRFSHPARYGSLGNIEAQHFQLAVNAGCTPGQVLCNHVEDEFAQLPADAFSSHTDPTPREPPPIQLEPYPMPANDGLRLDKDQCPLPSRPKPPQHHPKQFIRSAKPQLRVALPQDCKLLPKSQIFQQQVAARAKELGR